MTTASQYSSSKSRCSTIISSFWTGLNPSICALHTFTSAGMTASTPYVGENGVFLVDLRGVVQYAHKTLGNSSTQLPLAPSNLLFNPFKIALLTASAYQLLWGYAGVEYLFMMPRPRQKSWKALLSNCNIKLQPIMGDEGVRHSKPCNYILPYELCDINILNVG